MHEPAIAIVLLLVGLALLTLEVFIPSAGLIFLTAMASIGGSLWMAWKAWYVQSPVLWWSYLTGVVACVPLVICGSLYLIPRTRLGKHILLQAPELDDVTPFNEEQERLDALIGRRGQTQSILNPGGIVDVDGQRFHCESEGMIVDAQRAVDIVAVTGNRLIVRLAANGTQEVSDAIEPDADATLKDAGSPVDFDVPDV